LPARFEHRLAIPAFDGEAATGAALPPVGQGTQGRHERRVIRGRKERGAAIFGDGDWLSTGQRHRGRRHALEAQGTAEALGAVELRRIRRAQDNWCPDRGVVDGRYVSKARAATKAVPIGGAELLDLSGGVARYEQGHQTGLPLLAPWANRLGGWRYEIDGVEVRVKHAFDPKGLFNAGLEAKQSRSIDLHQGDKIDARALQDLIRAAVDFKPPPRKR